MPDLKKMLTLEALSEALPSWLKRSTKPEYNADEIDSTLTTNQFVTASDKDNWNAKGTYSKPSGGIPKSDLSSIVQTSLEKADSALQSETDPTVPSWAKQSSKPSYTQDEVPDGTTYKRVTQTEKNTWSGKQNALTTPQMQAVNSGITSEKVTQISTNQTNILYGLNRNAKNLIDFKFNDITTLGVGYYWDTACDLPAGTYSISFLLTSTQQAGMEVTVDGSATTKYLETGTKVSHEYTFTATTSITRVRFWLNGDTNIIYDFMISLKDVYDADSTYQPYSAPNYDLTQLQAEDRAALAEVVDEGAKNKLDCNTITLKPLNTSGVWNANTYSFNDGTTSFAINSDLTITCNKSDTGTGRSMTLGNYSDGADLNGMVISGGSSITTLTVQKASSPYTTYADSTGDGVVISGIPANTDVRIVISLLPNVTCSNVVIKPMLCTEADWKISQNFAQYALPNTDLTQLEAEDRAALAEVVDEGAKNVLRYTFEGSKSANGITVTRNADGTITANGTAGSGNSYVLLSQDLTLSAGTYIISAVNASDSNCYIYDNASWESVSGNQERTLDGSTSIPILLRVTEGTMLSNVVIKPMICRKEAWDISTAFVPYRSDYNSIAKFIEGVDIGGTNAVSNADLNSIDRTITRIYDNPSNAPYGLYGFMLVKTLYTDANTVFQEVTAVNNQTGTMFDSVRPKFIRTKTGGSWDPWIEMAENNRFLIDDGSYETATKTFNTTYLKYLRMYLITISRFYSPTSGSGVAMYAFNNSPSVPVLTTITEQSDCKATISVSNDVLTINYSEAGYYITSISLL